jgi:hypothetical protein
VKPPPALIDGARVVAWTPIDQRHRPTGETRHYRDGLLQAAPAGLAIATYDDREFYLFYADENWTTLNDTLHDSVAEAKRQAELEFEGTAGTWRDAG